MCRATSNNDQGSQATMKELLTVVEDLHRQNELLQDNVPALWPNQHQPPLEDDGL